MKLSIAILATPFIATTVAAGKGGKNGNDSYCYTGIMTEQGTNDMIVKAAMNIDGDPDTVELGDHFLWSLNELCVGLDKSCNKGDSAFPLGYAQGFCPGPPPH
jgi:hypothetical protein